ncbi:MAG TPA: hypothetical protein VE615_02400 [Gaiellaceae bacterium]|nr:hypothetical protein [Gaiellaceae bacterium]
MATASNDPAMMNVGLKGLLLLLAIVLFIVAALSEDNQWDFLTWGLAVFAAGHLVESIPLSGRWGGRQS